MADSDSKSPNWETEILTLLNELTEVQDEMLSLLSRKRKVMAKGDRESMTEMEPDENRLCDRLIDCQKRRTHLLSDAATAGMPSRSLKQLAASLPGGDRPELSNKIEETTTRIRLLQHESLANWVVAQKAVLHVAHILEILATGGKLKPTYGDEGSSLMRGNLVDHEA